MSNDISKQDRYKMVYTVYYNNKKSKFAFENKNTYRRSGVVVKQRSEEGSVKPLTENSDCMYTRL